MRYIWRQIVQIYLQIGFIFFYKKIKVFGKENIPKNKGVILVANHQNSLIDALLIATNYGINTYYIARAKVFNNSIVRTLLSSINMLPIYRARDGFETLSKNEAVFQKCYKILEDNKAILIFPEGSHNIQRRIRAITKGFTRIAFGTLENNPNTEVVIIPVGLNYSNHSAYASKVSIYYGKPISANEFWANYDKNESVKELRSEVSKQLKLVTTHIENADNYSEIITYFNKDEFLYPDKVNEKLKNLDNLSPIKKSSPKKHFNPLLLLVKINSFFPLLIWKKVRPKIKEIEFTATFKYVLGITVFPIFYLLQSLIIGLIFNSTIGYYYFLLSFLSVFILTKTKN